MTEADLSGDPRETLETLRRQLLQLRPPSLDEPHSSTAGQRQLVEQICSRIAAPELAEILSDEAGEHPLLMMASRFGVLPVVRALLDAGCPPNARDIRRRNALHHAAQGPPGDEALEITLTLVTAGTRIDAPDTSDLTPLMLAAKNSNMGMVELLLDAGADPTLVASGLSVARHAAGPNQHKILELLRQRAPRRPAVIFAESDEAVAAEIGCQRWLDALPGDGMVWAVHGRLDAVAAACSLALAAGRIDHLESRPAPRVHGGWMLFQLKESEWTLLEPFGSEWGRFERVSPRASELSGALRDELLTLRVSDVMENLMVQRLRAGQIVESATWEPDGVCVAFRSEIRRRPDWLQTPQRTTRKEKAAHWRRAFGRYFAELSLEVPRFHLTRDGLDTQLVLPETARDRVVGVECLSR